MDIRTALKSQYHAALTMLADAIERCPPELWYSKAYTNPFWHVAYHVLFYTHLYIGKNEAAFVPWEHHREEYQFMGDGPWDPPRAPRIGEAYGKAEIQSYWRLCEAMVDDAVDRLDLDANDCGFSWYSMPKLDHQLLNIRHLQHHTAQLVERVRQATGQGVSWVGSVPRNRPIRS